MKGTIVFRDAMQQTATVVFRAISDLNALNLLSGTLGNYSDACDVKRTIHESTIDAAPVYGSGPYRMVDDKAVIVYRDLGATPDETSVFRFELPGPKDTMFEDVKGEGLRVTAAAGNAIIGALATATGKSLEFVEGYHVGGK